MIKKIHFFIFLCTVYSLLNALPVFANPSDDDGEPEYTSSFHVYNDVDLVSTLKLEYGKPRIIIKSIYPQLVSDTDHNGVDSFNELSLQIVKDEIAKYRNQVKDAAPTQKKMAKGTITNNLYIDYDTSYIKPGHDHIISIRFSIQGIIGGKAHPYLDHLALNYNLDKGQRIELSDLFLPDSNYLDVLSDYSYNVLYRQLSNKSMIANGTAPKSENFQIWNLKSNGLLITFDTNQVAPRLYGTQSVLIPYTVLSPVIAPDSPIDDCIKHSMRCVRNHLLTGGFIDEAAAGPANAKQWGDPRRESRDIPLLG